MIVQDGAEAVCEECGLIIRKTVSTNGTSYIHHLPVVPASQAGKEQLDEYYKKCPNLYQELRVK